MTNKKALKRLQWHTLQLYLDDVIVFSNNFESQVERQVVVCQCFCAARLKLRPVECYLFQREVHYLGHIVSQQDVATNSAKIQAVTEKNVSF